MCRARVLLAPRARGQTQSKPMMAASSECDRQLLVAAAAKLVAEHREVILEFLNLP